MKLYGKEYDSIKVQMHVLCCAIIKQGFWELKATRLTTEDVLCICSLNVATEESFEAYKQFQYYPPEFFPCIYVYNCKSSIQSLLCTLLNQSKGI